MPSDETIPAHKGLEGSSVFTRSEDVAWERPDDGIRRQILGYDEGLMLVRVLFDEGAVGEQHRHPHRQTSYVESGVFEVEIAGEKAVLRAGDGFFVPPDALHGAVALEAGSLIDVFSPARGSFIGTDDDFAFSNGAKSPRQWRGPSTEGATSSIEPTS